MFLCFAQVLFVHFIQYSVLHFHFAYAILLLQEENIFLQHIDANTNKWKAVIAEKLIVDLQVMCYKVCFKWNVPDAEYQRDIRV